MDIVEVLGKKNRKVPILLTKNMLHAVNALIQTRDSVGIPLENPYIFAVVSVLFSSVHLAIALS